MTHSQALRTKIVTILIALFSAMLAGCAAPVYTTDDGSEVDEKLLSSIRQYGKAEQTVRPQIIKTAELKDPDCSTQWELPFSVATSYDKPQMDKIAWVRGIGVDERLTVISVAKGVGLELGEKIKELDGYHSEDAEDMLEELAELREDGDPFEVVTSTGKKVLINPVEICRGYFQITNPYALDAQEYHWLQSTHPLSLFNQELTPDEALWVVLWTQGLSEEAGARMKTYHYGMKLVKTAVTVASIASGVGAAANAASAAAANVAATEATKAAAQAAGKEVVKFAAQEVADSVRRKMVEAAAKEIAKSAAQDIAIVSVQNAAMFRGSLSGISYVAGTGFYMADKWAFDRIEKLGGDPLSAYTLHFKLASHAQADNAFVFDEERLKLMIGFAEAKGYGKSVKEILAGGPEIESIADGESIALPTTEVRELDAAPPAPVVIEPTTPALDGDAQAAVVAPDQGAPTPAVASADDATVSRNSEKVHAAPSIAVQP